jgi:polyribonucleotide nucleotidyltransferase
VDLEPRFLSTSKRSLHTNNATSCARKDHASIAVLQDAIAGTRTHGTVTGATPTGVFVSFFNGIRGLVHASALGLAEDQAPDDAFRVGQVCGVPLVLPTGSGH